MPPIINYDLCNKCNLCVKICPMDVMQTDEDKKPVAMYPDECWHCNACSLDCPQKAITLRYPLPHMLLYVDAKK